MQKKVAPPPVSDINVTPMVDVMLVLLIIFMVITPMLTKGQTVDMVRTKNPIAMQAADKEDADSDRRHAKRKRIPEPWQHQIAARTSFRKEFAICSPTEWTRCATSRPTPERVTRRWKMSWII